MPAMGAGQQGMQQQQPMGYPDQAQGQQPMHMQQQPQGMQPPQLFTPGVALGGGAVSPMPVQQGQPGAPQQGQGYFAPAQQQGQGQGYPQDNKDVQYGNAPGQGGVAGVTQQFGQMGMGGAGMVSRERRGGVDTR